MENRFLLRLSLIIAVALFGSCASAPDPPERVASVPEFESYMNKVVESGTPPGMSFAVVRNDSVIYSKGFGWADEPKQARASPATVYHWWSCTKIVTAIAILQLQERGKLSLGDPVVQYLPFFKPEYPFDTSKAVTILHLLNHSSGMPDASAMTLMRWIHHDDEPPLNQTEFLKKVLPDYSELRFEPGDHAEYSNVGYMVLGAVIENVTGMTYEDYVRQNILLPLEMTHTDFVYTEAMEPDVAAGSHPVFNLMSPLLPIIARSYIRERDGGHLWMERVYTDQTPSTALIGSPTDAAKLVAAYLNDGIYHGKRILSHESIAAMTYDGRIKSRNQDSLNFRGQGIGWQISGKSGRWVLSHEGGGPGFRSRIQLHPDAHLGFVLFANDVTFEPWKIVNLAATLKW